MHIRPEQYWKDSFWMNPTRILCVYRVRTYYTYIENACLSDLELAHLGEAYYGSAFVCTLVPIIFRATS